VGPILAIYGFKRVLSVIKYQELMPDPFDRSGIFHSQWKQGLGKHASGQPWQDQHQSLDI
jgi:hypothetical protein